MIIVDILISAQSLTENFPGPPQFKSVTGPRQKAPDCISM